MSLARELEKSGRIPNEFADGAAEVSLLCKRGFSDMEDSPVEVQATEFERDGDGNVIFDDATGHPQRVALIYEDGEPVMEMHPLHHRFKHHGLHAYRFEELEDGSAIALWANTKDGKVKIKAFKNMAEASQWHPRLEKKDSIWTKPAPDENASLKTKTIKREQ